MWLVSLLYPSPHYPRADVVSRSIHDLSLAAHAFNDIRFPGGNRNPDSGRAGTKQSHCWAYVQGLCRVRDCPYLHPVAIGLCTSSFVPQVNNLLTH